MIHRARLPRFKRCIRSGLMIVSLVGTVQCFADEVSATVLLRGGWVHSGLNEELRREDVWLRDDLIAGVGDGEHITAAQVLDVTGLVIAPGFIDLHSHAVREDPERSGLYLWPDAENQVRQGVTTVIGGPDGWSDLPIESSFEKIGRQGAAINFGSFVGHGAVRKRIIGLDDRAPTDLELAAMQRLVDQAMRQGAFGLSSGLVYTPGKFAGTDELIALARVAGRHGGIYISHIRNEALEVLDSVEELILIAERAQLPAQITHAKAMGTAMQGRSMDMLEMVDSALKRGLDITLDQYPYTAGHTGLTVQFPRWSRDGGDERLRERLADPELRQKIREFLIFQLTEVRGRNDPANVQLSWCAWNHALDGLNLSQVLEQQGREVNIENAAELIMELVGAGGCQAVYHAMHEEDVETIMRHAGTMIAADGGIEIPGNGHPHPRNYGTFSRVLGHYVRELRTLPLHSALYKMTGMPADRIGLARRGRMVPDAVADLVVFDPDTITDRATFADPHRYAEGVRHVFVAGEAVLLSERMTGARPGRILRSASYAPASQP